MESEDIKLLLVRYITSQADDAEALQVKAWIKQHPENEQYFIELYEAWQHMLYTRPGVIDEEKAHKLFLARTAASKPPAFPVAWLSIAAVVCIMAVSAIYIFRPAQLSVGGVRQIAAQKGAVKKVVLADGTAVWLNAASVIRYDAGFGKANRSVYLEGEAFFDIAHGDNKAPFLVKTKNYTVRDIGTRFNLKAYPNDTFFETTVIKGEVAVETNTGDDPQNINRIYVKPHQVLKINYHQERAAKERLAASPASFNEVRVLQVDSSKMDVYAGWKDDLLVFDGSRLADMAMVLERRYNVKINIKDDYIKNIRYSGSFKSVPTISKVLMLIKQNTPINYDIDGNEITITKTD